MTYLEAVNAVLSRLREDTVTTLAGSDDVVVNMVKDFVNDAKRTVEDAHTWSNLAAEWTPVTATDSDRIVLTNSSRSAIIDNVFDAEGHELSVVSKPYLRQKALRAGSDKNDPRYYIIDGAEANGDVRLRLWPAPKSVDTLYVYGYHRTPALADDTDVLVVPGQPVVYYAEALAARERGETGAIASSELFAMAKQYLSDAIAMDATNSDTDNIWTTI